MEIDEADLPVVAAAFGDLADIKTPFTHGHSSEVARLSVAAATRLGLDRETIARLQVAALLHDLGRAGVSNAVWEKPGPLTTAEWEQVRMHPYYSERILAASASLAPWPPSRACTTSVSTGPATTGAAAGRPSVPPPGSWRRRTRSRR